VTNAAGAVLCAPGCALTPSLIERLANAGVETVYIQGGGRRGPAAADRLQVLQARFDGITNPAMMELKKAVEYRLEAIRKQEEEAGEP
jgi:methylmalonyl-CoA mutase cobalamin-binding subunit